MLSSLLNVRTGALLATAALGLFSLSCRTASNQAFVHYQRPPRPERLSVAPIKPDTIPHATESSRPSSDLPNGSTTAELPASTLHPRPVHIQNPEAQPRSRKAWLKQASLASNPTTEYAPRHTAPLLTSKRKVPGLAKAALAGGVISQGVVLLGMASGTVWLLSILLPLASVMMGIASLAQLTRRPEKYMGKGWAMSGIMLATGALGLALLAAAALTASEAIWK